MGSKAVYVKCSRCKQMKPYLSLFTNGTEEPPFCGECAEKEEAVQKTAATVGQDDHRKTQLMQ